MIDAWLLQQFPGRTLEELDQMDFARLNRVIHARKIQRILQESLRGKEEALTKDEWAEVKELDDLHRRHYG